MYSPKASMRYVRTSLKGFAWKLKNGVGWLKALTKGKFLTTNLGLFDIELIKDVLWSSTAFDQLVLPHDYKRIIQAFVGAQMSGLDNFDDVIKGKGNASKMKWRSNLTNPMQDEESLCF